MTPDVQRVLFNQRNQLIDVQKKFFSAGALVKLMAEVLLPLKDLRNGYSFQVKQGPSRLISQGTLVDVVLKRGFQFWHFEKSGDRVDLVDSHLSFLG